MEGMMYQEDVAERDNVVYLQPRRSVNSAMKSAAIALNNAPRDTPWRDGMLQAGMALSKRALYLEQELRQDTAAMVWVSEIAMISTYLILNSQE